MLFGMIGIFGVNWLPIHLFNFYTSYIYLNGDQKETNFQGNESHLIGYYSSHLFSISCTFINPIGYSFMNKHFKIDLINLLRCNRNHDKEQLLNSIRERAFIHRSTLKADRHNAIQRLSYQECNLYLKPEINFRLRTFSDGMYSTHLSPF